MYVLCKAVKEKDLDGQLRSKLGTFFFVDTQLYKKGNINRLPQIFWHRLRIKQSFKCAYYLKIDLILILFVFIYVHI